MKLFYKNIPKAGAIVITSDVDLIGFVICRSYADGRPFHMEFVYGLTAYPIFDNMGAFTISKDADREATITSKIANSTIIVLAPYNVQFSSYEQENGNS